MHARDRRPRRLVCALAAALSAALVAGVEPATANIPGDNATSAAVPDNDPAGVLSPLFVADSGVVTDVDVALRIDHPNDADLDISLLRGATTVDLTSDNGGTGNNFGSGAANCSGTLTVFDDEATTSIAAGSAPFTGTFDPEVALTAFDGLSAAGTWRLRVVDDTATNTGTIRCFQLRLGLSTGGSVTVTTTSDVLDLTDGLVSLREAIDIAAADGIDTTITLGAGATYSLSCGPAGEDNLNRDGDLDLDSDQATTIVGNGATLRPAGCADERVLHLTGSGSVSLSDLTITGGRGRVGGGGILAIGPAVSMARVTMEDNDVAPNPGCLTSCLAAGGAAYLVGVGGGAASISDSTFRDNRASTPSCTSSCTAFGGHLLGSANPATIERSTFVDGSADDGGVCASDCQAAGGGILPVFVVLDRVSLSSNEVTGSDLCTTTCRAVGGGVAASEVNVVRNSTVADNLARGGAACTSGCAHHGGGVATFESAAALTLVHVTIAGNSAPTGANLSTSLPTHTISVAATAVGGGNDEPGASGCLVTGTVTSGGHNRESGTGCGFGAPTDASAVGDLHLVPAGPGGLDLAPGGASPLWDAIPAASCTVAVDRLGSVRPQGGGCEVGAVENAPIAANRFVALPPLRVFDTRPAEPAPGPKGVVPAGGSIDVQITGVAGVPADAVAVVLNVTATESAGAGFVTAWPTGQPRPLASSLNLTSAGQTRANSVTVPVGAGGLVSLFTQAGAHLLADVAGYYVPVTGPQHTGRIVTVPPQRVFDSRPAEPAPGPKGFVAAGATVDVQVTGVGGVPATGVAAVVLNVTASEAAAPGFVTVWPAGQPQPLASSLNLNATGETAPNLVMVPVGTGGRISLFSQTGAHLLADVTGYVTDDTAPSGTAGLYVALSPTRLFDTRESEPTPGPKGVVGPGSTITTQVAGVASIPASASGVVLNVTATGSAGTGFVTAWPAGQSRPGASTLNLVTGDTRANAALLPLGTGGRIDYYSQAGAHLLADTAGYLLG